MCDRETVDAELRATKGAVKPTSILSNCSHACADHSGFSASVDAISRRKRLRHRRSCARETVVQARADRVYRTASIWNRSVIATRARLGYSSVSNDIRCYRSD